MPADCTDGSDNDGDGDIDCFDTDCANSPDCANVELDCSTVRMTTVTVTSTVTTEIVKTIQVVKAWKSSLTVRMVRTMMVMV